MSTFRDTYLTPLYEELSEVTANYTIQPARYAKGKWIIQSKSTTGFKTSVHQTVEALGGKYTNREKGYTLSSAQVRKFKALEKAGVEGRVSLVTRKGVFYHPDNPREYLTPEDIAAIYKKYK